MKCSWHKIFLSFRENYPELYRRGSSYQPYTIGAITIRIPGVGKLIYYYDDEDIKWMEHWSDDNVVKHVEKAQRPILYEKFRIMLIEYLTNNNITQQQLADLVGISRQSLSKYLNGESIPKVSTMRRIGKHIDFDI